MRLVLKLLNKEFANSIFLRRPFIFSLESETVDFGATAIVLEFQLVAYLHGFIVLAFGGIFSDARKTIRFSLI